MASDRWIAELVPCQHSALYAPIPTVNDTLFCRACQTWRVCAKVKRECVAVCSCGERWRYGSDMARLRRVAIRHLRQNPTHAWVKIKKGDQVAEKIEGKQDPLIVTGS